MTNAPAGLAARSKQDEPGRTDDGRGGLAEEVALAIF
jgi:hypothetical protein